MKTNWKFNFWYRVRILFLGGQANYVMRKLGGKKATDRKVSEAVKDNLNKHLSCQHSDHNGGKCTLPCLWCKKLKKVEGAENGNKHRTESKRREFNDISR